MKVEKDKKRFINYIIIGATLSVMIWLGMEEYKDSQIKKEEIIYQTQNLSTLDIINEQEKKEDDKTKENSTKEVIYPKEQITNQYKGYQVAAKLEIPNIKLETYILEKYSIAALNISVTKFWGAEPNQIGNFCVAGHNFPNRNMFYNLKELKIGNQLFIIDNTVGKIEYEIYDIYKVPPEDISCLSQQTNEKREVTLITCTSDSEQRIIVKSRENCH